VVGCPSSAYALVAGLDFNDLARMSDGFSFVLRVMISRRIAYVLY
jgi:hypothetical protein